MTQLIFQPLETKAPSALFEGLWQVPPAPAICDLLSVGETRGEELGAQIVRAIAGAADLPGGVGGVPTGDFWMHAWATARAAEMLARERVADTGDAFLAGLLHDVGKVVLAANAAEAYADCVSQAAAVGGILLQAERVGLGVDHPSLGVCALRAWGFSQAVAGPVGEHHRARRLTRVSPLGRLLQAANSIAHAARIGASGNLQPIPLALVDDPDIGLSRAEAERCLVELTQRREEIWRLVSESL